MKNYIKPTLEIAKITTNEAIAAGSFSFQGVETDTDGSTPVSVYLIDSFGSSSVASTEA